MAKNLFTSLFMDVVFHKEERVPASKTFQRIGLLFKKDKETAKRYLEILKEEGFIKEEREGRGRGKLNFVKI